MEQYKIWQANEEGQPHSASDAYGAEHLSRLLGTALSFPVLRFCCIHTPIP